MAKENEIPRLPPKPPGMTPDEAIFEVWQKTTRLETVILGVPNTDDRGLVGKVADNCDDIEEQKKKTGKLENRFWILVACLVGSGGLGGFGLAELLSKAP